MFPHAARGHGRAQESLKGEYSGRIRPIKQKGAVKERPAEAVNGSLRRKDAKARRSAGLGRLLVHRMSADR